ncbi:MAG: DUF2156 domain-containing protein [Bdellovibrionales bacterium]|nr:DUF2156 domain-containing protein [Bdellovibrionales bacterium]
MNDILELVPSTWTYSEGQTSSPRLHTVLLPNGRVFAPYARHGVLAPKQFLSKTIESLTPLQPLIRGVPKRLAQALHESLGYESLSFGSEAILSPDTFSPSPSLRALSRRALRKGRVMRTPSFSSSSYKFRSSVRLRGLFRTIPSARHLSAGYFQENSALVFISLSQKAEHHYHLELLKRTPNAPIGAVEAVLLQVISDLKTLGATSLSLGEVPCIGSGESFASSPLSYAASSIATRVGIFALHPSYSASSLFSFKNKFQPDWRPVYWCLPPKAALTSLYFALRATRVQALVIDGLKKRLQRSHG